MQVTIHTAKTQLSKLIEAVKAGEDVIIAKGTEPVARLVAIQKGQFKTGILKDKLDGSLPDFLAPLDDATLADWEGH